MRVSLVFQNLPLLPYRHQPPDYRDLTPPSSPGQRRVDPPVISAPPTCDLTISTLFPTSVSPPFQPCAKSEDKDNNSDNKVKTKEEVEKLAKELEIPLNHGEEETPLKPLPPPMQPEITPEARLAAVRAQCEGTSFSVTRIRF